MDEDFAELKEKQEQSHLRVAELREIRERFEEQQRGDRSRRAQVVNERDARLQSLREEVMNLNAAARDAAGGSRANP